MAIVLSEKFLEKIRTTLKYISFHLNFTFLIKIFILRIVALYAVTRISTETCLVYFLPCPFIALI